MKVLVAGDFAPQARLAKQIEEKRYSDVFPENLREEIKSVDFSFVNFESPIVEDAYKPIPKCGPNLHCTPEAAEAIKFAGFTGVTMANNHILDFGTNGLHKSVACCKNQGLEVVGVGNSLKDAEEILYIKKSGKTLAVINCCEHEFSIATETESGANPLNPVRQFYAIQEAKKNADYVLVIVHGGYEHYQLPSPRMQETYRFFIDAGADAVVNHHQHCYSGYETYKGKPIFYGLGNFCFDIEPIKDNTTWNFGYMVELNLEDSIEFKLYPYNQYGKKATIEFVELSSFENQLKNLNLIISDTILLNKKIKEYFATCADFERFILEPYSGRIQTKLFDMGILPSLISNNKELMILNHISCEAHRDKLVYALKHNRI